MKRFFAAAALSFCLAASSAFAIVGGPWDGDVYGNPDKVNPSSYNGTYQGTIKGKNLSGITVFGTSTLGTSVVEVSGSTTTPSLGTSQGYAMIFIEGKLVTAELAAVVDLGARKISGVLDGSGMRTTTTRLYNLYVTPKVYWSVTDSAELSGSFSAKLSSNWAANSYTGKGTMMVTKVDIDGFAKQVAADPTSAVPLIVTVPTTFTVAGVKTSSIPASFYVNTSSASDPAVNGPTPVTTP